MSWQQIRCQCNAKNQQAITDLLDNLGAVSITYEDAEDNPILEPLPGETRLWNALIISALFEQTTNLPLVELALNNLALSHTDISPDNIETSIIEDQQWERVWMDDFHPMQFGDNLWIYPTWCDQPDDGSTKILLDPGLAFGTGTHPTTALCLEWLDQHPPLAQSVIDYGCGSGILAIATAKLGAKHITATDIDEQALIATQSNSATNQIPETLIHTCYPEDMPGHAVNLVMANILSGPLVELAPKLLNYCLSGGHIVLSGILQEQTHDTLEAYAHALINPQVTNKDGWVCISGQKK